jgi:extracellular factor (EF) 3-hydroxypalmitic acid methyl ester biosynthesis protein
MELKNVCYTLLRAFEKLTHESTQTELNDFLYDFSSTIEHLETRYSTSDIIGELEPIRREVAISPFLKRAQEWPRGYPGDFETIDQIINAKNMATPGTLSHIIEDYFLQSPVCEQHRIKINEQAALVKQAIAQNPAARILSIGCGTSEDLYRSIPVIQSSFCSITLVDIDGMALRHSADRLRPIRDKLSLIKGNIYKVIRNLDEHFDLVVAGGVFDYLNDKTIVILLEELLQRLYLKGRLFFTNISDGNPFRICMEYLANWNLFGRSESDIVALLQQTSANSLRNTIRKDSTGLTYLVTINKM